MFAAFDEPNLIAHAGLVPVIRLAERCDLPALVAEKVKLTGATVRVPPARLLTFELREN